MQCPNCGQENQPGAAYCLRCGTRLEQSGGPEASPSAERAEKPTASAQVPPSPPVSHDPGEAELTHRGHAFGAGYGADFYGVWDLRIAGEPVARFDRTPIGWEAAWRKFQELDSRQAVPAWRRPGVGWILLHILIGFVGTLLVQGVAIGIVLVATGREDFDPTPRVGAALTLSVLAGMIAWLLFVYLNKSRRVRWVVFLAAFLSAFTLGVVVSLAAQPAA